MASKIVQYLGTGRRKTAVARIFLRPGKGDFTVNGRALEAYFPTEACRSSVKQALLATETADKFDVLILAHGGGINGQASAVRMGLSRALVQFNAGNAAKASKARLPHSRRRQKARAEKVRAKGRP